MEKNDKYLLLEDATRWDLIVIIIIIIIIIVIIIITIIIN